MKRHKLNTPLNIQFTLAFSNITVVFARSRCKTLGLGSRSGCDVSSASQIPNTSLLLCLSAQLKSQTGVLRLVPCCDFSMHGTGENVLAGFEFVKDGKRGARLGSMIHLSWEMLKRSIRGQHKCDELQSYCKRCL